MNGKQFSRPTPGKAHRPKRVSLFCDLLELCLERRRFLLEILSPAGLGLGFGSRLLERRLVLPPPPLREPPLLPRAHALLSDPRANMGKMGKR